ncbi:hypothetical protein ACFY2G_04245 [Streptomyces collinus]|uniref:hypothetical protein n=1 Tax=Streptomyces collinus TaxID=42684 RepID=UPI00369D1EF1
MPHRTAEQPPPASPLPPTDLGVMSMLTVPDMGVLSDRQRRGATCVWCPEQLTADTAIDLGHRRLVLDGEPTTCFPRACRRCARRAAIREARVHPQDCAQCAVEPADCRNLAAITRLAADGR